ncbi:MAG: winged helix-turn-helix transcriptional regulator [Pseudomonadota bacterium]
MDAKLLVKLTSRTWSLSILAHLHRGVPARQAPLMAATRAGRTAFAASLKHLVELALLERNPGHGHPLRPEYRLTEVGKDAARVAAQIVDAVPDEGQFAVLRRSWTVPVLAITQTPQRFSRIKARLAPITDRALSQSLRELETRDWLRREIETSERVPYPTYLAVNTGRQVAQALDLAA